MEKILVANQNFLVSSKSKKASIQRFSLSVDVYFYLYNTEGRLRFVESIFE